MEFQAGEFPDALPTYIPPRESPGDQPGIGGEIPHNVISPKSHAFLNSSYGNLPAQLHHAGEQVVIINPKDALARNVGEGSAVRIFNDRGSFEAIAKVSAGLPRVIVVAPLWILARLRAVLQSARQRSQPWMSTRGSRKWHRRFRMPLA